LVHLVSHAQIHSHQFSQTAKLEHVFEVGAHHFFESRDICIGKQAHAPINFFRYFCVALSVSRHDFTDISFETSQASKKIANIPFEIFMVVV